MTGSGLDLNFLYVSVAKIYAYFKRSDNLLPSQTPPKAYLAPPVPAYFARRCPGLVPHLDAPWAVPIPAQTAMV
jgi:hypothetical protein